MRRRQAPKREIMPDPVFGSKLATKFVNKIMWDGKKNIASSAFYNAVDILADGKEKVEGFKVGIAANVFLSC